MRGPIKLALDAIEHCQESLVECEHYMVNMEVGEVLLFIVTFFVVLFVILRIIHYITKDTEIY